MSNEILFYHWPTPRTRVVHWLLEELAAPYTTRVLNLPGGEHHAPEFLTLNPMGKVPVIVHAGCVVTETGAIVTYLADAFPAAALAPAVNEPLRGGYLRWMFFSAACVDAAIVDRLLARPAPTGGVALGYSSHERVVEVLEQALSRGPYLLGDRFTAADLCVAAQLTFAMQAGAVEARPLFTEYTQRLTARPAFRRSMALSDQILAIHGRPPAGPAPR